MNPGWKTKLPRAVRHQVDVANRAIEQINSDLELFPRYGRPRRFTYKKPAIIAGSTTDELNRRFKTLEEILGPRTRGNVRWGRVAQYAELRDEFERLRAAGVSLPSDSSLSAEACWHGLGDWLRRYGYSRYSDAGLAKNGRKREIICRTKCGSAFNRVKQVLENTPLKIGKL